jgi:hypothetical protein
VSEALDLRATLAGIRSTAGRVPLVGCTTAGEIAPDGPADGGVVVIALGGDGFAATVGAAEGASRALRQAGAQAAACASELDEDHPHRVLILLTDGLAGDQQEIVRGAYTAVGAGMPLVGGCAGDDMRMRATHQLFGDHVLTDAVVAAALASDAPLGIGVHHGWRRVAEPMLVTDSESNRVMTIDDQPALDVYLDRLEAPAAVRGDPDEFTRFAATHPLGLASRRGEEHVRYVSGADFAARSLDCIAEVPRGVLAWLMEGDEESVLAATDSACTDALYALGDEPPRGLIAFDCIARRSVLGDGIGAEIDRIAAHGGGAPVAGFYTYGEIARTRGISGFHNQTLVVLAVG